MSSNHLRDYCALVAKNLCQLRRASVLIAVLFVFSTPAFGDRIFVDATASPPGDGEAWGTAFPTLQQGLALADALGAGPHEIWVAEGTYIPGTTAASTFSLVAGVSVYGGFDGTESQLSQRNPDPETNGTILSGLYNGPSYVYHVVTATDIDEQISATRHLDGFMIEDGRAVGSDEDASGGGILCIAGGNVRINNCIIEDCRADLSGGGAAAVGSYPAFTLCTFRENSAGVQEESVGYGSGLAVNNPTDGSDECLIYNCTFYDNAGPAHGGGIAVVEDDTQENDVSRARIVNCLLYENAAQPLVGELATPSVYGGGIWIGGGTRPTDAANGDAVAILVNCTLADNEASGEDKGTNLAVQVTNDIVSNEVIVIDNCILWLMGADVTDANFKAFAGAGAVEVDYTYGIECDGSPPYGCTNEIECEPRFKNALANDYRLREQSAGLDEGSNGLVEEDIFNLDGDGSSTDDNPELDAEERIQDTTVDIGAFEGGECFADTNGDEVVNVTDLLAVLAKWGSCPACPEDITGGTCPDNIVDVEDLLALLAAWGPCDPEELPIEDWSELHDEAGISTEEYEDYLEVMDTGSQQDKERWHCWYTWRVQCAANPPGGPSPCSGEDPFDGGLGGGGT